MLPSTCNKFFNKIINKVNRIMIKITIISWSKKKKKPISIYTIKFDTQIWYLVSSSIRKGRPSVEIVYTSNTTMRVPNMVNNVLTLPWLLLRWVYVCLDSFCEEVWRPRLQFVWYGAKWMEKFSNIVHLLSIHVQF